MALYKAAASILNDIEQKNGSVKSLVISSHFKNTKQLYALVVETLKYRDVLQEIILKTKILSGVHLSNHEAMVLIHDFLFGKGVRCGGRYKKIIHARKSQLKSALAVIKVKRKVRSDEELIPKETAQATNIPKYLRVNTLLTVQKDVVEYFRKSGYELKSSTRSPSDLSKKEFLVDPDIPGLLAFHHATDLHDDRLYKSGEIIFQDKASCLPAFILDPPKGSKVIDACAAPGNKTSHLAAIMSNRGKIFAFDINPQRLNTMDTLLLKSGALCCETKVQDFLKVNPEAKEYRDVQYILLDPSCSGSGIVSRLNSLTDDGDSSSAERLESLSKFQYSALAHALQFPAVQKVVYSTCSIHKVENEDVVKKALDSYAEFELVDIMPKWKNRGLPTEGLDASMCVRCSPTDDLTNGFFVAMFRRK